MSIVNVSIPEPYPYCYGLQDPDPRLEYESHYPQKLKRIICAGGLVQQPYAGVDFIPQSGIYEFYYSIVLQQRQLCFGLPDPPCFAQIILILGFF
jgi:hypothetical protein